MVAADVLSCKSVIRNILYRFDNSEVLGCRISIYWYRDVRKGFHSGMLFLAS